MNGIQMEILRLMPMGRNADRDAKCYKAIWMGGYPFWGWGCVFRVCAISLHTNPTYHFHLDLKIDPSLRACLGHDGRERILQRNFIYENSPEDVPQPKHQAQKPIPTLSSRARRNQTPQQSRAEQPSKKDLPYANAKAARWHTIPESQPCHETKRGESGLSCCL